MQVCTLLETDNHASTPPLIFYRPDALPAAQPTASKHWRHVATHVNNFTDQQYYDTELPSVDYGFTDLHGIWVHCQHSKFHRPRPLLPSSLFLPPLCPLSNPASSFLINQSIIYLLIKYKCFSHDNKRAGQTRLLSSYSCPRSKI